MVIIFAVKNRNSSKRKNHNTNYAGESSTEELFKNEADTFDYGDLSKIKLYRESHPAVMKDFIEKFNWKDQLRYNPGKEKMKQQKHEKLKYRFLTFIEQTFFKGRLLFGFKNYKLLKK